MQHLFSIEQLLEATGGRAENVNAEYISSVSIDSRTIEPDGLYVAIKGDRFDGHGFVHKAVVNGAAVALVSANKARELAGLPLIIVPDALAGLVDIARMARARSSAKIVAVTGSVGKTTTKSLIQGILCQVGETHASIKSYNNHWGVPLMLANMPITAKYGVFEIGMNHSGEITPLVELVRPHVALVTNVGPAHIGNFDTMEGIALAKAEILQGIEAGGVAIVNSDHDNLKIFERAANTQPQIDLMTFGFSKSADVEIFDYRATPEGSLAQAQFGSASVNFELFVPGEHMACNGVGALCVANWLGIDFGVAVDGLAGFSASGGRGKTLLLGEQDNPLIVIDESYNANPASMRAVLKVFAQHAPVSGNKVLVLGDMLELGKNSAVMHMSLVEDIVASGAQKLFLVGDQMGALEGAFPKEMDVVWAQNVAQINQILLNSLDYGDVIMVKGSLGIALSRVVEAIQQRFELVDSV